MIKKSSGISNPKNIFNSNLFWDAENIDIEQHAAYIISRVLDYGNERDLKILREIYLDEKLIEVIKKRRGIMPKTARFWSVYFKIPVQEIECLKMFYQKKQLK
jgi:Family of unknown function (DUF6922)